MFTCSFPLLRLVVSSALWILDWELAMYGPASTHLGQFCESWTSAHFRDHDAGLRLLQSFKAPYLAAGLPACCGVAYFTPLDWIRWCRISVAPSCPCHCGVDAPSWLECWSDDENKIEKTLGAIFDHILTAWDALKNNKDVDWWIAL